MSWRNNRCKPSPLHIYFTIGMSSLFSHCSYRLPWCSFGSNVIFSSNQIVITLEFVHWESKRAFLPKHATRSARSVGSCKFSSKFIRFTSVANDTDKAHGHLYNIVKYLQTLRRKWLLETKWHTLKQQKQWPILYQRSIFISFESTSYISCWEALYFNQSSYSKHISLTSVQALGNVPRSPMGYFFSNNDRYEGNNDVIVQHWKCHFTEWVSLL